MRALILFLAGLVAFVAYAATTLHPKPAASTEPVTTAQPTPGVPATVVTTTTTISDDVVPAPRVTAEARGVEPTATRGNAQGLTIQEATARIAASRGRPSIVLLYGTQCPLSRRMFGDFVALARRHPEIDVLAFATDEELAPELPDFLQSHGASFAPIYIREWQPGALTQAMATLGIDAGATWVRPLLAVRDAGGRVVAQGQGVTDVAAVEQTLARLR